MRTYVCFHCGATKELPTGLCTKCNMFPAAAHERYLKFAYDLDQLQQQKNNGRGISCVQSIVNFIYRNEISLAKNIYEVDGDKIAGYLYPDIDQMICEFLNLVPRYGTNYWKEM
jgi:predicted ATP-dependent serine protease